MEAQVFYTANTQFLPHEILVKEIAFSRLNDTSTTKIPRSLLTKPLDITMQSQMNEIADPESKVKEKLSEKYDLSGDDLIRLHIRINNMSMGVAAMIDDHAISSSVIRPQASS